MTRPEDVLDDYGRRYPPVTRPASSRHLVASEGNWRILSYTNHDA